MARKTKSTLPEDPAQSRPCFASLEGFVRERVQEYIQALLEEEVTELLGRRKSERRDAVDPQAGSRNGHGKPRRLALSCGTVTLRRPRVRHLDERFESRVLPWFRRHTGEVGTLLPELYLHGLAKRDFDLALRGLLGAGAPLSPSSIARLKARWQAEYEAWKSSSLEDLEPVYLWADGLYVKAGLDREKAAILVVIAALRDGTKRIVALRSGYRESTASWSEVLRELKARGLKAPRLMIADGNLGLWGALAEVYPQTAEQRCWNHKILNVLDRIPKKLQAEARELLTRIPYADTVEDAERRKKRFEDWCRKHQLKDAAQTLQRDWARMLTFYGFPQDHWKHLRTSNVVESPFAAVRLRTDAAKRYKRVENATAVLWRLLLVAEKRFRKLNAPELLPEVAEGVNYRNGLRVTKTQRTLAA